MVSIDWLQVSYNRTSQSPHFFEGLTFHSEGCSFELAQGTEFNAVFVDNFTVKMNGIPVATMSATSRMSERQRSLCIIKLRNPLLYTSSYLRVLNRIASGLYLKFASVSRIDLCADFNFFVNKLSPREFIRRYQQGTPTTDTPSYIRVGSNRYEMIGRKNEETMCHDVDYLRFGTRSGGFCAYLYNKSAELNEQKNKQYIRDLWEKWGLKDDDSHPVYRLEFSILPSAQIMKRQRNSEDRKELGLVKGVTKRLKEFDVVRLGLSDIETQQKTEELFFAYASKFFRFKEVGTQKYKHNWKDVQLFDFSLDTNLKPVRVSKSHDSVVCYRNAMSLLRRMFESDSDELDIGDREILWSAHNLLQRRCSQVAKEISYEDLQRVFDYRIRGYSLDEIGKLKICDMGRLNEIQDYINRIVLVKMRPYTENPRVMEKINEALTEEDAIMDKIKEDNAILETLQGCTRPF